MVALRTISVLLFQIVYLCVVHCVDLKQKAVLVRSCPFPFPSPDSDWSQWNLTFVDNFRLVQDASLPNQSTIVYLCRTEQAFIMQFRCKDNNIFNPYVKCNSPLYNYDVVEIFVTMDDAEVPTNYLEVEVSPNSVLFVASVYNPNGNCPGIVDKLIDCVSSGIVWSSKRDEAQSLWLAYLSIPFDLIANASSPKSLVKLADDSIDGGHRMSLTEGHRFRKTMSLKANFFRIDQPLGNAEREFSAWNPTITNPACFHKPFYFGNVTFA